ncbi:hypothetical protein [Actinomadura hibisca]|uniref:hypothetical protein n=1 Tax=Actinomadura hibisca TaxID=68565 RepID=UPI0008348F6F|nr:hypothetical protein [Actinomadura hibisca]
MTTPVQPDTGTGDAPDTGTAPTTEAPDIDAPDTGEEIDWKAEAEKNKALARKHEARAKANKKALDEALAKGRPADGEPTVDDLRAQAEADAARADAAEARAAELAYETTVTRIARTVGADAEALLDSDSFRSAVVDELDDDDFDDAELRAAVTKVAKQFAKRSRFAASSGPSRSGGEFHGGPGAAASIDQQIADAEKNRDFATAIALKRQRAALK